jgi:hypothetical protein
VKTITFDLPRPLVSVTQASPTGQPSVEVRAL